MAPFPTLYTTNRSCFFLGGRGSPIVERVFVDQVADVDNAVWNEHKAIE